MILPKVVTFTGPDDSVDAGELIALSKDYPNTEWGILFGAKDSGSGRFPSLDWLDSEIPLLEAEGLNLTAHLCGKWVYELVLFGDFTWLHYYGDKITRAFQRVQLNFHGQKYPPAAKTFLDRIGEEPYQFIFQDDTVNGHLPGPLGTDKRVRLFDVSHGAGTLPEGDGNPWPKRTTKEYMGYAGGLGPQNISTQLKLIEQAAAPSKYGPYWIDMETKVRSGGDSLFDLSKCRSVCKQVWG